MNMTFFDVFFVLGFLLYSALGAALGSAVNSEQEAQQFQFLIMMPLIVSVIFMTPVIQQPHSTMATVPSLIPFCTPLLMYIRILVETPPLWQIALSVGPAGGNDLRNALDLFPHLPNWDPHVR